MDGEIFEGKMMIKFFFKIGREKRGCEKLEGTSFGEKDDYESFFKSLKGEKRMGIMEGEIFKRKIMIIFFLNWRVGKMEENIFRGENDNYEIFIKFETENEGCKTLKAENQKFKH